MTNDVNNNIFIIITEILQDCVMGIRNSINPKYLKLEIEHLNVLLGVLKGGVSILEYYNKFSDIFKYSKLEVKEFFIKYRFRYKYITYYQKKYVVNEKIFPLDKRCYLFISILNILYNNLLEHLENERYDLINNEGYMCHNVPYRLKDLHLDCIKYYLDIECFNRIFYEEIPYRYVSKYFNGWLKIAQIFNPRSVKIYKFKLWKYNLKHKGDLL